MCGKYKKCIFPCKSEDEFRILAEECLTFETVTSCLAQRLRSHVLAGLLAVLPSCKFSPDFKIAGEDVSGGDNYSIPGRFCTEFSSNFRRNSIRFRKSWQILYRVFYMPQCLLGLFEYFNGALQTAVYTVFRYFCFRPFCFRVCE